MPAILRLLVATTTVFQLIHPASASSGSTGCGKPLPSLLTPGGPSQNFTLTSQSVIGANTTRRYIAYLPERFAITNDVLKPLILAFHGQRQPVWSLERISGLSTGEFNTEYVVVYPEGLNYQEPGVRFSTIQNITSLIDGYSNNGSATLKHHPHP
jgi:poly(3-hydroxybutyrate) depolymerase